MAADAGDGSGAGSLTLGLLSLDVQAGTASLGGRALDLSQRHVELLAMLVVNRNRVLSRAELSSALGYQRGRSVDVLLSGLRQEMGFPFVRNVPKRGWIIMPEVLLGPGEGA
jgi:DNA-binding response OmpR family regulator